MRRGTRPGPGSTGGSAGSRRPRPAPPGRRRVPGRRRGAARRRGGRRRGRLAPGTPGPPRIGSRPPGRRGPGPLRRRPHTTAGHRPVNRPAHRPRTRDSPARRARQRQQGHRRRPRPVGTHRRQPPPPRLRQTRRHHPARTGPDPEDAITRSTPGSPARPVVDRDRRRSSSRVRVSRRPTAWVGVTAGQAVERGLRSESHTGEGRAEFVPEVFAYPMAFDPGGIDDAVTMPNSSSAPVLRDVAQLLEEIPVLGPCSTGEPLGALPGPVAAILPGG